MKAQAILLNEDESLRKKVEFLSKPVSYADTTTVEVIETHMSWVFLTDRFVYKLKKPVVRPFVNFGTLQLRHRHCQAEVNVNKKLAGDTYLGVVALRSHNGALQLNGAGEVVEWLVKMKRLPGERMLPAAIAAGNVNKDWVQAAAEKMADFYRTATPAPLTENEFRGRIVQDIEASRSGLLKKRLGLSMSEILTIEADLLRFVIKSTGIFDQRVAGGRIIDCHGDLRPEHICLGPDAVIIDRLEFDDRLRIMDIAEELSFFAMECEMLSSPGTGRLFLNVYKVKSGDRIPDTLLAFYKAKRAFLRAKLSISHLLEDRYQAEAQKWRVKCGAYLRAAATYCKTLAAC